jgi:hypothetical protein
MKELASGRVPLEALVVSQKLSRAVSEYRSPSPAAPRSSSVGTDWKKLRPGQMIAFLYTLGSVGVHAWDLPQPPKPAKIDIDRYATLLLRAASTITQPFGLDETALKRWIFTPNNAHLPEQRYTFKCSCLKFWRGAPEKETAQNQKLPLIQPGVGVQFLAGAGFSDIRQAFAGISGWTIQAIVLQPAAPDMPATTKPGREPDHHNDDIQIDWARGILISRTHPAQFALDSAQHFCF